MTSKKGTIIRVVVLIVTFILVFLCGVYFGKYQQEEKKPATAKDYLAENENFEWDGEHAKKAEKSKTVPKVRETFEAYCGLDVPMMTDNMRDGLLDDTEHSFKAETEERYLFIEKDIPADAEEMEGEITTFYDKQMMGIRKIIKVKDEEVMVEYAGIGNYGDIEAEFELLVETMSK